MLSVFRNVGEKPTVKNYHPVSLLSAVREFFEKPINNRIVHQLQKCGRFSDWQYGFTFSQSIADLLIVVSDRLARAFNRSGTIAFSISKAFYRFWHAGPLHKFESYGIFCQISGLVSSFLNNTWYLVVLNEKFSQEYPVVPQGSIRGPTLFLLYTNDLPNDVICNIAACKFQHFLLQQIKCRGNYMKINFASTFPWQCFGHDWQDFIRAWVFTSATLAKTLTRSKLVNLPLLLHISPRIRNIMCTIIVAQILLYKYCYMQCNVLFFYVKKFVLKIILDASFEFKSKNKYQRKMFNRLKRNFKRKIYINSFCLMSKVVFFFGASRWTNDKRKKPHKSCLKMWRCRISQIQWYKMWKQSMFHCNVKKEKEDE